MQNMVRIVQYVREEVVAHVSSQLKRRGIVGGVQAEPNSTSYRCFETLLVKPHHAGDAYKSLGGRRPCRRALTSRRSCRDGDAAVSARAVTVRTWR